MTAKDLKNALLQEAVQGKLVPQIASEGNARDLLEEIRKEKLSHGLDLRLEASLAINAKSGKRKSKKETALAGSNPCDITEEEIPFDIPENWCWCRLSEYLDIRDGTHDSPKFYDNGIPFVTSKNLNDGILDFSTCKYITEEDHKKFSARSFVEDGDILFAMIGSIGNPVIVKKKFDFSFKNMALFKRYTKEKTDMKYIFYYLSYIQFELKRIATGGVQSFIGLGTFREMLFPLPPLAEQKRIVAAIEKFMPLIEEYGKKESALKAINEQIGALTKKAILQEAVQGKLVPQIANEGNAKDLLEEIRKERLSHGFANSYGICSEKGKKSKSSDLRSKSQIRMITEITEDEIPFDIPENWCWCRLGEIIDTNIGLTYSPTDIVQSGGIAVLRSNNIQNGEIVYNDLVYVSKTVPEKCMAKKGDLLICARNGSRALVGKCAIIKESGMSFGAFMALIRSPFNSYIMNFINSPLYRARLEGVNTTTINQITQDNLKETLIPLPPLAEQKRIVAAIEKMLPLCKKLGE